MMAIDPSLRVEAVMKGKDSIRKMLKGYETPLQREEKTDLDVVDE